MARSQLATVCISSMLGACANDSASNNQLNTANDSVLDGVIDSDSGQLPLDLQKFKRTGNKSILAFVSGKGTILRPESCSDKIGSGANYLDGSSYLAGKCNNGGLPVQKRFDKEGIPFLEFRTDGSAAKSAESSEQDRSELADLSMISFGRVVAIEYEFQIPAASAWTYRPNTAIQFWQCAGGPPIAAMQVSEGRKITLNGGRVQDPSQQRGVTFLTRTYSKGKFSQVQVGTREFLPSQWQKVKIVTRVAPSAAGRFQVWFNDVLVGDSKGPIGISENVMEVFGKALPCPNRDYRIKFGIYKANEPHGKFLFRYRNLRITERE